MFMSWRWEVAVAAELAPPVELVVVLVVS